MRIYDRVLSIRRKLDLSFRLIYDYRTATHYGDANFISYNILYLYCFLGHIAFIPVFILLGNPYVLANNFFCIGVDVLCITLNFKGRHHLSLFLWLSEIAYHSAVCSLFFGWQSGFYFYFIGLAVCVFIGRWRASIKAGAALILFALQTGIFFRLSYFPPVVMISTETVVVLFVANTAAVFFGFIFLAFFYVRIIESIESELEKRNDELEWAHEMMNTDLRMAVNVQQSFFCRDVPQPEGYEISLYFKPLKEVSGDFYDFVLDGNEMKGIALFDVSGHGVASALITMIAKSIVDRHFTPDGRENLGSVLGAINDDLVREIGMTRNYLAGMVVMLKEHSFDYVNAGYQDIIIKKNGSGEIVVPDGDGFRCSFLGVPAFTCEVTPVNVPFEKGDVLFLFSDGLVEGENTGGKIYGFENISSSIRDIPSDTPLHIIMSTVISDFSRFTGTRRFLDDITLIVVKKTC